MDAVHGRLRLRQSANWRGIYGVPAPAKDFERVPFPAGFGTRGHARAGLFLALTAKPDDTSPTARGLFVREQFLCQHVPDPPPGVNTNLPPVTEAKPQTNRERMAEHATNPSCAACHKLIDPIGFGLEKFDAVGAAARQTSARVPRRPRAKTKRETQKPSKTVDLDAGHAAERWPAFRIRSSRRRRAGRGAGEEPAVPGVRGEAVFPVSGRADWKRRRTGPVIRKRTRRFPQFAVSALKS